MGIAVDSRLGLEARNAIPRTQGWNSMERTSRGFVGCIRSSASIEFLRSRALRNRDGSARGIFTYARGTRRWDEPSTSTRKRTLTAAIGMCSRTGVGETRHIQFRWLWIQYAIRDKVVRVRNVRGTDNEADMGTKDLDAPTHQRLLQKLPLKPTQCRRLLGLIATANGGSVDGSADEWK